VSRRDQISMSAEEVSSFLAEQRVLTCATLGPRGWPHLMPLWYVLRPSPPGPVSPVSGPPVSGRPVSGPSSTDAHEQSIWAWTYAASQKVRNLERDARATLLLERGEQYQELRGVMLECEVFLHRDTQVVAALGREIFERYASPPRDRSAEQPPPDPLSAEVAAMVEKQAAKRVALEFAELRRASWDHRKLGGVY
jgi:hypothetical protein